MHPPPPGKPGFNISEGFGTSFEGDVYIDKVEIDELVFAEQDIFVNKKEMITKSIPQNFDGIFGVASSSRMPDYGVKYKSWFDNIRRQLKEPVIGVALKHLAVGTYDFGFTDSKKYDGAITWESVVNSEFGWEVNIMGYTIGNDTEITPTTIRSIINTGDPLMHLPTKIVREYYNQIKGAEQLNNNTTWAIPCSTRPENLPNLSLIIAGKRMTVLGRHMLYSLIPNVKLGSCWYMGGLQNGEGQIVNLGYTFFKGQYVVFQQGENGPDRIGFAEASS
jgi:aspergillopepsin I